MKKLIFCIVLFFAANQLISAQDINSWVSSLSVAENAEYQQVDKSMLEAAMQMAPNITDSTGATVSQAPPAFMKKMESIDMINLSSCPKGVKEQFIKDFDNIRDENGYETLINVVDDTDKVRIIAKKEGNLIPQIYVFAIDNEDGEIVIVRMNGKMDDSDIADILKNTNKGK